MKELCIKCFKNMLFLAFFLGLVGSSTLTAQTSPKPNSKTSTSKLQKKRKVIQNAPSVLSNTERPENQTSFLTLPTEITGNWKVISLKPAKGRKVKLKKQEMTLLIHDSKDGFGSIRYSNVCRGVLFSQNISERNDGTFAIHEDNREFVLTMDIKPCDTKGTKEKMRFMKALQTMTDLTKVAYSVSTKGNEMSLTLVNGDVINLRK